MSWNDVTDAGAVRSAVAEFDRMGPRAFYQTYRFGPPKTQALIIDGREYPSKAILGVAHGYQFPSLGPLRAADFTGGEHTVKPVLERMGFELRAPSEAPMYGGGAGEFVEAAVAAVRGYRRARRVATAAELKAIERRAVTLATEHYQALGWSVEDVGATHSFDLRCIRGIEELHVEVKGTRGDGERVGLTRNEVQHARGYQPVSLVIAIGIELDRSAQPDPIASVGRLVVIDPWNIDEGVLEAVTFEYSPPRVD